MFQRSALVVDVHSPRLYSAIRFCIWSNLKEMSRTSAAQNTYNDLYSSLCKFSHLSARSFVPVSPIGDLVLHMKYFDAIAKYAYGSMDLALYCALKAMISQWDITEFIHSYVPLFKAGQLHAVRRSKFSLTFDLVSS